MIQTQLEKAFIAACRAFMDHYDLVSTINSDLVEEEGAPEFRHQAEPTPTSNGIPVCPRHGKAMKPGKYGYYCSTKESDPRFSNKQGWCNQRG